jgi:hypothetical protein
MKEVKGLAPGDLVKVDWYDASIGKSLSGGVNGIDVPVQSWGIFLGVLGKKNKHIILAQNNFHYSNDLYDIDYTAIPVAWASCTIAIVKNHVPHDEVMELVNSFLLGGKRPMKCRIKQQKAHAHDRLD